MGVNNYVPADLMKQMRATGATNCQLYPHQGKWYASGHFPGKPLVWRSGDSAEEAVRLFVQAMTGQDAERESAVLGGKHG